MNVSLFKDTDLLNSNFFFYTTKTGAYRSTNGVSFRRTKWIMGSWWNENEAVVVLQIMMSSTIKGSSLSETRAPLTMQRSPTILTTVFMQFKINDTMELNLT